MVRQYGDGGIQQIGNRLYITYYSHGKQVRESTGKLNWGYARQMLRDRLAEIGKGINPAKAKKLTYADLRAMFVSHCQMKNLRSLHTFTQDGKKVVTVNGLKYLDKFFAGWKAVEIDTAAIRKFIKEREDAGARGTTINRSTALLSKMFNLAKQDELLQIVPYIPKFSEKENVRQGFVTLEEFLAIRKYLPVALHPFFTFLYDSGIRFGEANQITWNMIDMEEGVFRVPGRICKNKEGHTVPISAELMGMLKKMFRKDGALVFSTVNHRKAWTAATKSAELPHILVHDMRRSGVRNYRKLGVDETVIMAISGHKTSSVFKRYNIVDAADVKAAQDKKDKSVIESKLNQTAIAGDKK